MTRASSIILPPLGALYGAITETRLALYRRGILNISRLDAPVISIGNITTGGTGKTPLVEYIARALAAEGRQVCILTRGYGRQNQKARVLVSDAQKVLAGEKEAGDEPFLLAENLQGIAAVISDADRFAAGQWAIRELGSEVFILDDGFQHLRLARNLNVAMIDATNPWGDGQLLPRGRLRERRGGLARADCILITRADQAEDVESLRGELDKVSNHRPLFTSVMRVRGLRKFDQPLPTNAARAKPEIEPPVAAFCAIGNPGAFMDQIRNAGYELVGASVFPDHHRYDQRDVGSIIEKARKEGAKSLITTAKDAVKLRGLAFDFSCYVLDIEIRIDDESRFKEMIRAAIASKLR